MPMYRFRLRGKKDNGELIVEYRTRTFHSIIDLQEYKHTFRQEFNDRGFKEIAIVTKELHDSDELFGI